MNRAALIQSLPPTAAAALQILPRYAQRDPRALGILCDLGLSKSHYLPPRLAAATRAALRREDSASVFNGYAKGKRIAPLVESIHYFDQETQENRTEIIYSDDPADYIDATKMASFIGDAAELIERAERVADQIEHFERFSTRAWAAKSGKTQRRGQQLKAQWKKEYERDLEILKKRFIRAWESGEPIKPPSIIEPMDSVAWKNARQVDLIGFEEGVQS